MTMLLGRLLGAAAMASGRPAGTFFVVLLLTAVTVDPALLPSGLGWTLSPLAVGLAGVAALVELVLQHIEGVDELLREAHVSHVASGLLMVPASMLLLLVSATGQVAEEASVEELVSRGLTPEQAEQVVAEGLERVEAELDAAGLEGTAAWEPGVQTSGLPADPDAAAEGGAVAADLVQAVVRVEATDHSTPVKALLLGGALAMNLLLSWMRGELKEVAEDVGLEKLWAWLEGGGVLVAAVLLVLLPQLLLALTLAFCFFMVGCWLLGRGWTAALDARRRRPCPHCERRIRVEALCCAACGRAVEPVRLLDVHGRPVSAADASPEGAGALA